MKKIINFLQKADLDEKNYKLIKLLKGFKTICKNGL